MIEKRTILLLKHLQSQGQALLNKGFEASIVEKTDGGILCMQLISMSADVDNFGAWVELSRMICVCINLLYGEF